MKIEDFIGLNCDATKSSGKTQLRFARPIN